MTGYTLATSPFGNFAVSVGDPDTLPRTLEVYHLDPVGELDALPMKKLNPLPRPVLDQDALAAEAVRQLRARGTDRAPFVTPSPEFTVNRVVYSDRLSISLMRPYDTAASPFWSVGTRGVSSSLTPSARTKLELWWESAYPEVVTDRFKLEAAEDRAAYDLHHAFREMERKHAEYLEARARHESSTAAWVDASDALAAAVSA